MVSQASFYELVKKNDDTISFLARVDTCSAMNTGNLLLQNYIIAKYTSHETEFIQYDDADPFDIIILQCAVADLVKAENYHGNITAIVRYWTPYTFTDGKSVIISFGIRSGVTVFSIIILPTITQWGCMVNIGNGQLIALAIETVFPLMFEQSKNGPPEGVK